jgi:hypothetical protein
MRASNNYKYKKHNKSIVLLTNMLIEKNERIRNKGRETRNKRKAQAAKSFEIKLDKSKISKEKLDNLQRLFLEGKWFTNYIISKDITNLVPYKDYKVDKVNEAVENLIYITSNL